MRHLVRIPTLQTRRSLLLSIGALPFASSAGTSIVAEPIERPEWSRLFSDADAVGSVLVADERTGSSSTWVLGPERSRRRFTPASTFKIPHSLFALDAGLIKDEFEVIPWDRVKRPTETW